MTELTKEETAELMKLVRRESLECAWAALGFMAACGTLGDRRIGIVNQKMPSTASWKPGEIVIFDTYGKYACIGIPMRTERLGGAGFIADVSATINVPADYITPLDPRSDRIKQTARKV